MGKLPVFLLLIAALQQQGRCLGDSSAYTNCTFPPLCKDRPYVFTLLDDVYIPHEPCSCINDCALYGDCCPDAPAHIYNSVEQDLLQGIQGHDSFTCEPLIPAGITPGPTSVFMVDWCPVGTDNLLNAKCTKDTSMASFNYTYLLDVPVVSSTSDIVYQNAYCGTCQRDIYFETYNYDVNCNCDIVSTAVLQNLTYQEGNLTWTGPRPIDIRCMNPENITCFLKVEYPAGTGHRCEENLIDECYGNGGLFKRELKQGCENGTNYYLQDKNSVVYKNINCSMCNGVNLNDIICLQPYAHESQTLPQAGDLWTISDLFNFDEDCDISHIGDPVFGGCDLIETIPDFVANLTNITDKWNNSNHLIQDLLGPSPESIFFMVMMALSIVCLLLHIIIFIILFKERNLHSQNLFSMACALFLAELTFVFGANLCNGPTSCYILTILVYYFFLAAFFWMNIMSYDICKTFYSTGIRARSSRRFQKYCAYAWGVPLVITLCALMVDTFAYNSSVAPNFAAHGFWFGQKGGLLLFFVIPVEIIFVFNLVMLVMSANEIRKQKKFGKFAASSVKNIKKTKYDKAMESEDKKIHKLITGKIKKTLHDHEDQIKKLKLNASLAVLMGVPWIFAILVSYSVVFEYLFNIVNSLQGVFILLAFDCKRKVWNDVKQTTSSYSSRKTATSELSNNSNSSSGGRRRTDPSTKQSRNRGDSAVSRSTNDTYVSQETEMLLSSGNPRSTKKELQCSKMKNISNHTEELKSRTERLAAAPTLVSEDIAHRKETSDDEFLPPPNYETTTNFNANSDQTKEDCVQTTEPEALNEQVKDPQQHSIPFEEKSEQRVRQQKRKKRRKKRRDSDYSSDSSRLRNRNNSLRQACYSSSDDNSVMD